MSDKIPLEIQMEIIEKVYDFKLLNRFRSVCKAWKSFIDSSQFINRYGDHHTEPHSLILNYRADYSSGTKLTCLVNDDIETFKVLKQELAPFVMSPLLKQYCITSVVGECCGLLCLYGFLKLTNMNRMVVIWNPSIGRSFGIVVPDDYNRQIQIRNTYGFGVCPVTSDPTVVKIVYTDNMSWHVEVFTLSSGVWNVIPGGNLPRQSIRLYSFSQVVIDKFIYWGARGKSAKNQMVVSFDLITKKFKVVDLPESFTNELDGPVCVSKLKESLVVYRSMNFLGAQGCGVWVMNHDSSFLKLFTIGACVGNIFGFSKSGETIFENRKEDLRLTTLDVYDPCSQQIKNLGISGIGGSFFIGSYKESLFLLDHLDSRIYYDKN